MKQRTAYRWTLRHESKKNVSKHYENHMTLGQQNGASDEIRMKTHSDNNNDDEVGKASSNRTRERTSSRAETL